MPPKKASVHTSKKAAGTAPAHPSYQDMIKEAIIGLKDRQGSSRQALKKYVLANHKLENVPDTTFNSQFNRALAKGTESGIFNRPKGASGTVKLAKPDTAAAKPVTEKKTTEKKTTAKKATAAAPKEKKAPAAKKATVTKTTKKAAAPKKAAATKKVTATKANTSKARKTKTPTTAPAVEEKAPVVLTKTKTGRVVKSSAPQAEKKVTKGRKAPAKRSTPKKAAKKA